MDKERTLYDAFVQTLLDKVQGGTATPKELEIVMNFLKHQGLSKLASEATALPFEDEDELPAERNLKRIK